MKRYLLPLLLAAFPLIAWSAPVCVDPEQPGSSQPARNGIGGTGSPAMSRPAGNSEASDGGGIGGTGSPALGGGIGGTGAPVADGSTVGIVGVVSGFASVCVNGVEVHFEHGVPVSENGEASSTEKLAVGQVVSIEAIHSPRGLLARDIAILNALEGPVTHLPHGGKVIQVLGQNILIGPGTRGKTQGLAIGQLVRISALAGADGTLIATRVQPSPDLKHSSALGQVVAARINGVAIAAALTAPTALVRGHWSGSALIPTNVNADPTYRFMNSASRILLEGLVQTTDGRGKITAGGVAFLLPHATSSEIRALQPNQRIFVDAQVGHSGQLLVNHLEFEGIEKRHSPPPNKPDQPANLPSFRTETSETLPTAEKLDTPDKLEKVDSAQKVERVDKLEKVDRIEKPERVDKPERIEKPERIDKPERIEKPEKPERH